MPGLKDHTCATLRCLQLQSHQKLSPNDERDIYVIYMTGILSITVDYIIRRDHRTEGDNAGFFGVRWRLSLPQAIVAGRLVLVIPLTLLHALHRYLWDWRGTC